MKVRRSFVIKYSTFRILLKEIITFLFENLLPTTPLPFIFNIILKHLICEINMKRKKNNQDSFY